MWLAAGAFVVVVVAELVVLQPGNVPFKGKGNGNGKGKPVPLNGGNPVMLKGGRPVPLKGGKPNPVPLNGGNVPLNGGKPIGGKALQLKGTATPPSR